MAAVEPSPVQPTVGDLFRGFLIMGLTGFGGVLPHARRMLVERMRWLTGEEFTEILGLCQFLPGGNIINISIAVGQKFRGVGGAVAALLGLVVGPTVIVVGLSVLYESYRSDPAVARAFAGLAAAAAGLLLSMAIKIAWPMRGRPLAIGIVAISVIAIALLRLPLFAVILVLVPASILLSWRFEA
ncbi:MAG: chromate transporter [Sphingomonas sp.]|uniref:chromate transporter n=1 Tax=Sphingomonas sp. TaxID=28214 RepID=UPI002611A750|nr:chromate transporter [Sphingomonas sp.]MDK2770250.1 chromate transporter [Sphingomonas sp.]